MVESLFLVGGSVRAAMQSAQRAGIRAIHVADSFLDQELDAATSRTLITPPYRELSQHLRASGATAWLYTGALENHPEAIASGAEHTSALLLGNDASTLRAVRDPWQVVAALRDAQLDVAEICRPADLLLYPETRRTRWLLKPRASAAGRDIRVVILDNDAGDPSDDSDTSMSLHNDEWYAQQWIDGVAQAAIFVGANRACQLVGVTRQWTGADLGLTNRFQYAGSFGPLILNESTQRRWQAIGDALVARFPLQGIFGVDAIVNGPQIIPVEVNPRYTASVEILERATGWRAIRDHVIACRDGQLPDVSPLDQTLTNVAAKLIVFAKHAGRATPTWRAAIDREITTSATWPPIADLPRIDSHWPAGAPIVTLFADAGLRDAESCETRLLQALCARGDAICVESRG